MALLPQIAKLPKIHKIMVSRFVSRFEYAYCSLLNKGDILSFKDDLSGRLLKKISPKKYYKLLPLKTTVDIPIIISYTIGLQHSISGLRVLKFDLQTFVLPNLS